MLFDRTLMLFPLWAPLLLAGTGVDSVPLLFEPSGSQFLSRAGDCKLVVDARGGSFCGKGFHFEGGDETAEGQPDSAVSYINEYAGSDSKRWRTHVPAFSRVRYTNVYPGIDVLYYSSRGRLEYDFVLAPGADPRSIRMSFEGLDGVLIDEEGRAVIGAGREAVVLMPPVVYQEREGRRLAIRSSYIRRGPNALGIAVADYARNLALVVDPVLYATYLGGSGADSFNDLKLDPSGNIVVAGSTSSTDFPAATGASKGSDAVVVKLNSTGTAIVFVTYLGGSGTDAGLKAAIDSSGAVYVLGSSGSTDFPYSAGAYRVAPSTAEGVFIAKLNNTGGLVYSAQVQGQAQSSADTVTSLTADSAGRAIFAGGTTDKSLPVTAGAFQTAYGGGASDGFIGALNANGNGLAFLTYLGGGFDETVSAVALDSAGAIVAAGQASMTSVGSRPGCLAMKFPITPGAYRSAYACNISAAHAPSHSWTLTDSFVTKLNSSGTALVFSTFAPDVGNYGISSLVLDAGNNIYLGGVAASTYYALGASTSAQGFVSKLNASATSVLYSSQFGENQLLTCVTQCSNSLGISSMAPDTSGGLLAAGWTWSSAFPGYESGFGSATATPYLMHFDALLRPIFSTLFTTQSIGGLARDAAGTVYMAGTASAGQLTTTSGALQAGAGGGTDGFIERLTLDESNCSPSITASPTSFPSIAGSSAITVSNSPGCVISLSSSASWMTFDSNGLQHQSALFAGAGSQSIYIEANYGTASRTATITAGPVSLTVTQSGTAGCTYTLSPSGILAPASGAQGIFGVTPNPADCAYKPESDSSWVDAFVYYMGASYIVAANTSQTPRIGRITVGNQVFTVTQAAFGPSLTSLSPYAGAGPKTFTAVYSDSKGSQELSHAYFLMNTDVFVNGACYLDVNIAAGTVSLMNDAGTAWSTAIQLSAAGQLSNGQCSLDAGQSGMTASGNDVTVILALAFQPSFNGRKRIFLRAVDAAGLIADWLAYGVWFPNQVSPALITRYRLYHPGILAHLYTTDRNEYDVLGTRGWIQEGADAAVYEVPVTRSGSDAAPFYRLYLSQNYQHFWTTDRNEYLTLINQFPGLITGEGADSFLFGSQVPGSIALYRLLWNGAGPPLHHFTTDANEFSVLTSPGGGWMSEGIPGYLFPPGSTPSPAAEPIFDFRSAAHRPVRPSAPGVGSIADSASFRVGTAAPGQSVSLFGFFPDRDELRVRIGDSEAEILSASETEVRVVVPERLPGRNRLPVTVTAGSSRMKPVELELVEADPAIYASDPFGRGQAQAANEDGIENGEASPAPTGSVIALRVTGLAHERITAWIGGRPAEVVSTAARPGGNIVRLRVPGGLPGGRLPVRIQAGEAFSQSGVTIAVQDR